MRQSFLRKHRKIIPKVILISVGIGLLFLLVKVYSLASSYNALKQLKDPLVGDEFMKVIGEVQDMNKGILLSIIPMIDKTGLMPGDYLIKVKNNANESIIFPNNGFGIHLYSYQSERNSWREVELGILPGDYSITIKPESEIFKDYNPWILNTASMKGVDWHKPIRIFVSGTGESSGNRYGAYEDVFLKNR